MRVFWALLKRDFSLSFRANGAAWLPLLFLLAVAVALPFAVGPDLNLLMRIGGAFLWLGALLALFLTLDDLFKSDSNDGTLDVLMGHGHSPYMLCLYKILIQWILVGLPLSLVSIVLGVSYNLDGAFLLLLCASLVLGTLGLSAIGVLGASLMVSISHASLLLTLIILPFSLPLLIFAVSMLEAFSVDGVRFLASFKILSALVLFMFVLGVLAGGKALDSRA